MTDSIERLNVGDNHILDYENEIYTRHGDYYIRLELYSDYSEIESILTQFKNEDIFSTIVYYVGNGLLVYIFSRDDREYDIRIKNKIDYTPVICLNSFFPVRVSKILDRNRVRYALIDSYSSKNYVFIK